MSTKVTLTYNNISVDLPVITGTENESAVDIAALRSAANLVTLDPGYKNTGSCLSTITFLDGDLGILRYRGYAIEELAEKATFLEVAYLLIFGELPNIDQLTKFQNDIKANSFVDEDVKKIIDAFPKAANPMGVLA